MLCPNCGNENRSARPFCSKSRLSLVSSHASSRWATAPCMNTRSTSPPPVTWYAM